MTWRLARSLDQLRAETQARWPGTTVWTIGDAAHRGRASDHNPTRAGVVCATDTLGRGIAAEIWGHLLATRDPRVKYAIFDRQIVSSTVSPWQVRPYTGSNPHADHIHISVGRGPSGSSSRPDLYDDPAPWGLTANKTPAEPDPLEEIMASHDPLVRKRVNELVRLTEVAAAGAVAAIRADVGLPADPASDLVWVQHLRDGTDGVDWAHIRARLETAAKQR